MQLCHLPDPIPYPSQLWWWCILSHPWLFVTPRTVAPRTVALQIPLSMGFSRQEYWSGLPFPSQGIFLTQGSNPHLLCLLHWQADSFCHLPLPPTKKNESPALNHSSLSGKCFFLRSSPFISDFLSSGQNKGAPLAGRQRQMHFPCLFPSHPQLILMLLVLTFQALVHFPFWKWPPPRRLLLFLLSDGSRGILRGSLGCRRWEVAPPCLAVITSLSSCFLREGISCKTESWIMDAATEPAFRAD